MLLQPYRGMAIQMKRLQQYFSMEPFIFQYFTKRDLGIFFILKLEIKIKLCRTRVEDYGPDSQNLFYLKTKNFF